MTREATKAVSRLSASQASVRAPGRCEEVFVLAQADRGEHVLVGCQAQVVEHVVHLEAANQLLVRVDHRGDYEVVAFECPGRVGRIVGGMEKHPGPISMTVVT